MEYNTCPFCGESVWANNKTSEIIDSDVSSVKYIRCSYCDRVFKIGNENLIEEYV